jgi:ubiquinone/menaquinone biosynthesis C-methylase UbiE
VDQNLAVQSLFEDLSPSYDATGIDFFGLIGRTLVEYACLREGSTVLDVGCGAGAALIPAAQAVGAGGTVVGIDLAAGMVERAQQAVEELGLENVRVHVGDAEAPPVQPGSIDAIVASLVLFFLPNIDVALDAYARALAVGGTLAFSTFAADDDWTPLDQILARLTPAPPPAKEQDWFESGDGIRAMLEAHCFQTVSIQEVTHLVTFPTASAFYEWSWSTGWRSAWLAVPVEHREEAKAAADEYLQALNERHGCIRLATGVRYTRAHAK